MADLEKPSWRQALHSRVKRIEWRDVFTSAGVLTIYVGALVMMIVLPIQLIPQQATGKDGADPNVANNNNYLPSTCPLYTIIANEHGLPLSDGPLQLPFQRPPTECRTFSSSVMEKLITNITSRMVDKDLARLFENTYPNTLGTCAQDHSNPRHNCIMVQSRCVGSAVLCYYRRHSSPVDQRLISPIRAISPTTALRCRPPDSLPWTDKPPSKTYRGQTLL